MIRSLLNKTFILFIHAMAMFLSCCLAACPIQDEQTPYNDVLIIQAGGKADVTKSATHPKVPDAGSLICYKNVAKSQNW